MKILLDTNILARLAEPGTPANKTAVDALANLRTQAHELCLVPQNYYEFWVVSTRPLVQNGRGRTPDEVIAEIAVVKPLFKLLPDTPAIFPQWEGLVTTYKVSGKPAHDARLVAAMLTHGVTHILTFNDADFRRFAGITPLVPAGVAAGSNRR
jgi:predicted nucleic acid-binding protein